MTLNDFFGLDFNLKKFDINTLLDLMGLRRSIERTSQVTHISRQFGAYSTFTLLAKRQQTLKQFRGLLEQSLLPHDNLYYLKEVNTSLDTDRRYNAEDHFLQFMLIVAAGKTLRELQDQNIKPTTQALRNIAPSDRFDRLWELLGQVERDTITAFKKALK